MLCWTPWLRPLAFAVCVVGLVLLPWFFRISKILRMFEAMRMFKEVKIMVDSLQGSFMVACLGDYILRNLTI